MVHGEEVIEMYEQFIRTSTFHMNQIETLRGKTLGCYCKPEKCHGDILIKILKEINA